MKKVTWTYDMIDMLQTNYPRMSNTEVAQQIGVSESTMKRMAKQLGLRKGIKSDKINNIIILRENFNRNSFTELARIMGISKTSVARLAERLGLKRTSEIDSSIRSRVRREINRRDRLRIKVGMPPLTRLIERN